MKRPLIVMLIVWLAPTVTVAEQGVLRGKVTDTSGALLPGVSVEACGPASGGGCRNAVTNGSGYYILDNLMLGTYTVTLSLPGFITRVQEDVEIVAGDSRYLHGMLAVGALARRPDVPVPTDRTPRRVEVNRCEQHATGRVSGDWVFAGSGPGGERGGRARSIPRPTVDARPARSASDDSNGRGTKCGRRRETLPCHGPLLRVRAVDGRSGAYHLAVRTAEPSLKWMTPAAGALDHRVRAVGIWTFTGNSDARWRPWRTASAVQHPDAEPVAGRQALCVSDDLRRPAAPMRGGPSPAWSRPSLPGCARSTAGPALIPAQRNGGRGEPDTYYAGGSALATDRSGCWRFDRGTRDHACCAQMAGDFPLRAVELPQTGEACVHRGRRSPAL